MKSRRQLLAGGSASVLAMSIAATTARAMPHAGAGKAAGRSDVLRVGIGPCSTCAQEVGAGQRAEYQRCYALEGSDSPGTTCTRCGHSWYYHA